MSGLFACCGRCAPTHGNNMELDWTQAPSNWNWAAQDEDGRWFWYCVKPVLGIGGNPGSLNVNVNVSWLDKYEIASLPGTPMLDYSERIGNDALGGLSRSEEHTSELQSLMRISYAVCCLNKKKKLATE